MKQIQVNVPDDCSDQAEDLLNDYSFDVYSVEGSRKDETVKMFTATVKSKDIDQIVSELKDIKEIESGDLVIRVLDERSLIEKGQKTKGSSSMLSQQEVYSKAQESASLNRSQWALMGISSAIASYGLILDNIAVVIGAMMLAPMLSPLVSSAISLSIGDRTLLSTGLKTSFFSVLLAIFAASVSVLPFNVQITPVMKLVVSSEIPNILLSILVGSAASLAFATGLRDQIAGVAVSIALLPPLASFGIGIKMMDISFAISAFSIGMINLLAVIVSGSTTLKLLGFKPSTYYKKKSAEKLRVIYPASTVIMVFLILLLLLSPL